MTSVITEGLTIDAAHSVDLDDGLAVTTTATGWRLTVCVPDVAAAVAHDSFEDARALEQGVTIYSAERIRTPMLHRQTLQALTLQPGLDRPAIALHLEIDQQGHQQPLQWEKTSFRNIGRLTYDEVANAVTGGHNQTQHLRTLATLATRLNAKRMNDGALAEFDPDARWNPHLLRAGSRNPDIIGYLIVSECMIAANSAVARFFRDQAVAGALYRNHSRTRAETDDIARYRQALHDGDRTVIADLRNKVGYFFEQAAYGTDCEGHFALGLPAYCHFTSPLRRYVDLHNQRVLTGTPRATEGLSNVAAHLTTVGRARSQAYATAYHRTLDTVLAQAIETNALDQVDDEALARIIRSIAGGKRAAPAQLENEIRNRLKNARIDVLSLASIAFAPTSIFSSALKLTIGEHVLRAPQLASQIWALAQSRFRQPLPTWNITQAEGFVITGTYQDTSVTLRHPSKKLGQHLAAARILAAAHLGITSRQDAAPALQPHRGKHVSPGAKNELQELTQRARLPLPNYVLINAVRGNGHHQAYVEVQLRDGAPLQSPICNATPAPKQKPGRRAPCCRCWPKPFQPTGQRRPRTQPDHNPQSPNSTREQHKAIFLTPRTAIIRPARRSGIAPSTMAKGHRPCAHKGRERRNDRQPRVPHKPCLPC